MGRGGFSPHDDKDAQIDLRPDDHGLDPNEVCVCGDYRRQHKDWTGPSLLNWDNPKGTEPCLKFQRARKPQGGK